MNIPHLSQLIELEARGAAGVELLADVLTSSRPVATRAWAAAALGRLGPVGKEARPALASGLRDRDPAVRWQSSWALACHGASALPSLADALSDSDVAVTVASLEALGWLGDLARPLTSAIRGYTKHDDPVVALAALSALVRVTGSVRLRVRAIAKYLNHPYPAVRRAALERLGELRELSAKYTPKIVERLRDDDANVRRDAVLTLVKIDAVEDSIDGLAECAQDSDAEVRRALVIALDRSTDDRALATLEQLRRDEKRGIARAAELSLAADDPELAPTELEAPANSRGAA